MTDRLQIKGVFAPVVTPFNDDLSPDAKRLAAHCRWLLSQNCGLAIFGTNSEGNSMSVPERIDLIDALVADGIDTQRMLPGTGCCAFTDTVRLTAHVVNAGCAGVLMLPPFYYKGVSDDGLYASFAEVIERVGDERLRVYLYHIPQVAGVGVTRSVIARLLEHYPGTVAGIKDSSGDWDHTVGLIDAFSSSGFDVFVGSESFLLANMRHGGVGCISATANVNPGAIDWLYREWNKPEADEIQTKLDEVRTIVGTHGMIPSLKAVVAHFTAHREWANVRPPLTSLATDQTTDLIAQLKAIGFEMTGVEVA